MTASKPKITVGISPCPNDTFAFHALLTGKLVPKSFDLELQLLDVQQLNEKLAAGELLVSKASFHAALHLSSQYGVLPVGAALGFGVGPLLLAAAPNTAPTAETTVLCPGAWTTATLLLKLAYPEVSLIEHRIFSEIMNQLQTKQVGFGVVIHEGRFVYQQHGLSLVADLGALWEQSTQQPIPLGGLLAHHSVPANIREELTDLIRSSIDYGYAHKQEAFTTMQRYAQELSPETIWSHVDLYVSEQTRDLGETGRTAIKTLEQRAREVGAIPSNTPTLTVF